MTVASPAPPVAGYALEAPTHASVVEQLAKHVGPAEAERLWTAACAAVKVPRFGRAGTTPEAMREVAQHLAKERSIVGVCASAIVVRLISYIMLQRKQQQRQIDQAGAPAGR